MPLPELPKAWRYSDEMATASFDATAPWIIATFHTSGPDGRGYEQEAPYFAAHARKHGYADRTVIIDVGGLPSWRFSCMSRPGFIHWCLQHFPGQAVLWIDVDGRVHQKLKWLDKERPWEKADLHARLRPKEDPVSRITRDEWVSGTLLFSNNDRARAFCQRWAVMSAYASEAKGAYALVQSDQDILADLAAKDRDAGLLTVGALPDAYSWIPRDQSSYPTLERAIEHQQAHRRRAPDWGSDLVKMPQIHTPRR